MFCSPQCMNEANEKFHQFECDFNADGFGSFFTIAVRASLCTFSEALHLFDGSIDKLKNFISNNAIDGTVFDVDVRDVMYKRHLLIAMNSLCTNEHNRPTVEKFRRAIVCAILCDLLSEHSRMHSMLSDAGNANFFMRFMHRHTQIAESNYHELYALSPQKPYQHNEQFGVGSFPFASLINHSCSPNVFRLTFNSFNHIIVSKRIEKGHEILDNYG